MAKERKSIKSFGELRYKAAELWADIDEGSVETNEADKLFKQLIGDFIFLCRHQKHHVE